uniref:hypothetical protein n=1 Tax=Polaromonas sp. TaxID=1869339 RepID=UPI0015EEE212|nr:hypothetical protein [Polaromonas sp.]
MKVHSNGFPKKVLRVKKGKRDEGKDRQIRRLAWARNAWRAASAAHNQAVPRLQPPLMLSNIKYFIKSVF